MSIEHNLADAIRSYDKNKYLEIRFPKNQDNEGIPDGEDIIFENEDFSGVNFDGFLNGFVTFDKCNLDGAINIHSQPIYITDCSAKGIDLRGCGTVIEAAGSDFSGMVYDSDTVLAIKINNSPSIFTNCTVDVDMKNHFLKQGVIFNN